MRISEIISETGAQIGQIKHHMSRGPYLIMSGWRGNFTKEQNRQRNADLKRQLYQQNGLGSINQKGYWPVETDEQGNITQTGHEESLFIPMNQPTSPVRDPSEFSELAKSLMMQYDQDAVIVNDGQDTYLISNPNRPEYDPEPIRLGSDIKVFGAGQDIGDVPGWSQKKNYRYVVADKDHGSPR